MKPIDEATEKIKRHGCPFCDTEPQGLYLEGPDALHIHPCGHVYNPIASTDLPPVGTEITIDACPACGAAPEEISLQASGEVTLQPCGHTVSRSGVE